jgi:transcriptional regulator with XRE-family HTH domain
MSQKKKAAAPFHQLGVELKQTRQQRQESLAEVSGAVEIDIEVLAEYEKGAQRPAEDVLLLLISHFAVKEDHATKLWELAGYDQDEVPMTHMVNDDDGQAKSTVAVMPVDARIIYTDMVHVMVNNYGVVMNFMQGSGPNNQPLAVARIGMSKEHAQSVLEVLQKTLQQAESTQKSLPTPKSQSKKTNQE